MLLIIQHGLNIINSIFESENLNPRISIYVITPIKKSNTIFPIQTIKEILSKTPPPLLKYAPVNFNYLSFMLIKPFNQNTIIIP